MKKTSSFAVLVTAALTGIAAENACSHEITPGATAGPAGNTPAYGNGPASGWYPPPPPPNARGYAQPRQQQPYWPARPQGYGQFPPAYPPRGQYRSSPAVPATAVNPLSAELKHTQEQLTAKNAELGKVNANLEQLRVILQHRLEAEIALNEKVAAITGEQQAMQARVTELTTELNAATAALQQNRQQLTDNQQQAHELTAERDKLHDDIGNRDEQLATLRAELHTISQALKRAQAEISSSSQQLSDFRAQADASKNERTELQAQLDHRQTALQDVAQKLAGVIAERNKLQAELTTQSEALTQAQAALADDQSEQALATMTAERDKLQAELATQSEALTQAQAALADDQSEQLLAAMTAERDKLQAEFAARSEELTQARIALTSAQSEAKTLRQASAEAARVEIPSTTAPETDEKLKVAAVEIAALQTTELDSDGDSIPDRADLCGETRQGITVDATGCADGVAINLQGVNFLYDSHELTPEAQRILDRVAAILSKQPNLRLEVAGHTDAQGDPAYNQWLSLKRAEAVRDYLVAHGVNPNHIGAGGYGGQRPIADNTTKQGLRMNRRVELRRLQ